MMLRLTDPLVVQRLIVFNWHWKLSHGRVLLDHVLRFHLLRLVLVIHVVERHVLVLLQKLVVLKLIISINLTGPSTVGWLLPLSLVDQAGPRILFGEQFTLRLLLRMALRQLVPHLLITLL